MGRPTVRCLPCLPPREEKLFHRRHSHRGVAKRTPYYALPALPASIVNGLLCLIIISLSRGESPTGHRTTCLLPCLAPPEEKLFYGRHCNAVQRAACPACLPGEEKLFQRRHSQGRTKRCLPCMPPPEEKLFQSRHSHGGLAKRMSYYALPALPASVVNGPLCLPIEALSRGESPTGRPTMRCLPCLPPPEEKLFHPCLYYRLHAPQCIA